MSRSSIFRARALRANGTFGPCRSPHNSLRQSWCFASVLLRGQFQNSLGCRWTGGPCHPLIGDRVAVRRIGAVQSRRPSQYAVHALKYALKAWDRWDFSPQGRILTVSPSFSNPEFLPMLVLARLLERGQVPQATKRPKLAAPLEPVLIIRYKLTPPPHCPPTVSDWWYRQDAPKRSPRHCNV